MWCVIGRCGERPEGSINRNLNLEIKKVMGKGVVMLEMVEEEEEGWVWLGTLVMWNKVESE